MKDWKNISNETLWIRRAINIIIQTTRLTGKESNNIVLQYIRVNLILSWFFRSKIFLGGKNDPLPSYLENGSLYFHATWQTHTFHLFVKMFPEKKTFGGVAMTLMLLQYLKTKGHILETKSSPNMTFVTSHVIPNIFFGTCKGSSPKEIIVFSPSNVKYFKCLWWIDHKNGENGVLSTNHS